MKNIKKHFNSKKYLNKMLTFLKIMIKSLLSDKPNLFSYYQMSNLYKLHKILFTLLLVDLFLMQSQISLAKNLPFYIKQQKNTQSNERANKISKAELLYKQGNEFFQKNNFEKAIFYYEQAITIFQELNTQQQELALLNSLGIAYQSLNQINKAQEYLEKALQKQRLLPDKKNLAVVLNNLGALYKSINQFQKAIECLSEAEKLAIEDNYLEGQADACNNLGGVYFSLGDFENSVSFYKRALTIYQNLNNSTKESSTLNNLGASYGNLGNTENAIVVYKQSLEIKRKTNDLTGQGIILNNLANIYASTGQIEKAIESYQASLEICSKTRDLAGQGVILSNLGALSDLVSDYRKAVDYYQKALILKREAKDLTGEATTNANLMFAWSALSKPNLAIYYGKRAVNTFQQIRISIQGIKKESQQKYLDSKMQAYRKLADLLIETGRLLEAQQILDLLKQEEYEDFITRSDNDNDKNSESASLNSKEMVAEKRYSTLANNIVEIGARRGELLNKDTRSAAEEKEISTLEKQLESAKQEYEHYLGELSSELGDNKESGEKLFQIREAQGLMEDLRELGSGTVALYTLVSDKSVHVIMITPDVQKAYEYKIDSFELNQKVIQFREALQNPQKDPQPLAKELYQVLIGTLSQDLKAAKAETLMWSLDGVLRYLPISALHDGESYLIEKYRSVVFTPASQARLKDLPSKEWKCLGLGVSKFKKGFVPLPSVPEELRGIINDETDSEKKGVLAGTIKLDEEFTEESFRTGLRQRYPVVHIASHFKFQPGNETDSFLLLGDGNHFSLAQIKKLSFSGVELLTLSACNTAVGDINSTGKEVEGFAVLAQRQGAKAVVASLWPVFDRTTKTIMQEFYRLRAENPSLPKIEALRQAQLVLLKGKQEKLGTKYVHPFYWAPFILIGNWR